MRAWPGATMSGWYPSQKREAGCQVQLPVLAVRMTGVLVRQDGQWNVAQSHTSIGVPNAEMFG